MKKKRFIDTVVSFSLFAWLSQLVLGGIIQATVAFFTKRKLEQMKDLERKEKNV
jgi:hypothetical protein